MSSAVMISRLAIFTLRYMSSGAEVNPNIIKLGDAKTDSAT